MWINWNENPLSRNTGDCVVRAIAFASGRSWDDTYWSLAEAGFERGEMPSWNPTWWAYLKEHGFDRKIIPNSCPACYTVRDFTKDHPRGTFVLFIPHSSEGAGHVVAVKDGDYYDTWDSGDQVPLAYWERRK